MKEKNHLENIIEIFGLSIPEIMEGKYSIKKFENNDLPLWIKSSVDIYTLNIADFIILNFIQPRKEISFDLLLIIFNQISVKLGPFTLIIADRLSSKYRPLFVKFRIPFIYKNKTIFAPELFMVNNEINQYRKLKKNNEIKALKELGPLAFKLCAAYLTKLLKKEISLNELYHLLKNHGANISLSKLSYVLKELTEYNFMEIIGIGPNKKFKFKEYEEVWEELSTVNIKLFKTVQTFYLPDNKDGFTLSGESALSEYSNLSHPNQLTLAINSFQFKKIKEEKVSLYKNEQKTVNIQIWKEDPKLFSIDGKLNPVELYQSMQKDNDERIQIALEQLLQEFNLKIKKEIL